MSNALFFFIFIIVNIHTGYIGLPQGATEDLASKGIVNYLTDTDLVFIGSRRCKIPHFGDDKNFIKPDVCYYWLLAQYAIIYRW